MFIIAALGFFWRRLGRPFDGVFVTELVTMIGAPALIFSTLVELQLQPAILADMALASVIALLGFMALGAAALWATGQPLRVFLPALTFPNTGNMGLPLCLFAFGQEGLAYGIVFFAASAILQFVTAPIIAMGEVSLRRLARLPVVHAVLISVAVLAAGWEVPAWILNTTGLLGDATIPLMLMALGVSLSQLRLTTVPRAALLAVLRLGMGAGIALALGWLLDLGPVARGVLLIEAAMPAAVFNYLFAQKYDTRPGEVASVILLSTILSFLTLPLLLSVAMGL